ncbi:serpin B3-like [Leptodactylus fuscus]|uniref:serpin B3-like n=1 Tax=Leptodactylus fuscus TaxID=238119 RepID=UPI003F4E8D05
MNYQYHYIGRDTDPQPSDEDCEPYTGVLDCALPLPSSFWVFKWRIQPSLILAAKASPKTALRAMESISNSIKQLSSDLMTEIMKTNSGKNIVISPVGIYSALSSLRLGSGGDTAKQIEEFRDRLHLSNSPKSGSELTIVNAVFTPQGVPLSKDYVSSAQELYQTTVKAVDYQHGKASEEINSLVEAKTEGKIKNVFPENSLDISASLVLATATYFGGYYAQKFNAANTKNVPFYTTKDSQTSVAMMSQTDIFNVGEVKEINAKVIEIPFLDKELNMYIALPDEYRSLDKVENLMKPESVMTWTNAANMTPTRVDLQMPRMKVIEEYDLRGILKEHGMEDAFSPEKADLSGISDQGLHVSHMIQKVVMDLTEGTEDAAVTAAVTAPGSLQTPTKFIVDHPFMYMIKDIRSGTVMMQGICVSP